MKTRERKKEDLSALTEQFKSSKSAMVLSFSGLTVDKDQSFRNELRETGATYKVVKNTLARIAVKDTSFEEATEHFKGVTSVAWTNEEPVDLSKIIAKYLKEHKDIFEFKTGIVDGKVVSLEEVNAIASLPSKDELIAKLLFLLNAPAQRMATVLNAIPRDLAIVVKQVSERTDDQADVKAKEANPAEEAAKPESDAKAEQKTEEKPVDEATEKKDPEASGDEKSSEGSADEQKEEEASKADSDNDKAEADSEKDEK